MNFKGRSIKGLLAANLRHRYFMLMEVTNLDNMYRKCNAFLSCR